jgi:protein transport protein SEC23
MQFESIENKDGVRLTWNYFPTTPANEEKLAIPLAALYTPTRPVEGLGQVEYKPIMCMDQTCGAVLNPYCIVNYQQKTWNCALCNTRNNFPKHYQGITENHRPAELMGEYTTLEYQIGTKEQNPVFFYVVDISVIAQELDAIKNSIRQSLSLLPDNALVGFMTYGANIHVYDLSFSYCPRSYTFSGSSSTDIQKISQSLDLQWNNPNQKTQSRGKERFLTPIADCEADLGTILDHIQPDTWVYDPKTRPSRCTGLAIQLALNILELIHKGLNARILTLVGGAIVTAPPPAPTPPAPLPKAGAVPPPSAGKQTDTKTTTTPAKDATKQQNLGEIATNDFSDPLRSHHDIIKGDAPLNQPASEFYSKLAAQAVANRTIVDIFACCLDQVGVSEMYPLVTQTGGELILDDSFTRGVFQGSIKKTLQRELIQDEQTGRALPTGALLMAFGAELKVITSQHLLINGGLGHCTNLNTTNSKTINLKNPIGAGKTNSWYLGGLMPDSTFGVYFSVNPTGPQTKLQQGQPQQAYIQFLTTYKTANGGINLRCTTVCRNFGDDPNTARQSFDQEASVVAMTRLALHKLVLDPHQDIRRWLDRQLIKLCVKFGSYTKDDVQSFKLTQDFALYPQQMYYLRRSPLIQTFNSSPDETVFVRTITLRQDVSNTLTIIQPNLFAYDIAVGNAVNGGGGEAVLLDSSQLSPKRILLLDTFFQVVIWYGQTIAQWKAKEIWKDPQFEYIGALIKQPLYDAKQRIESRLPTPRFIECLEGGSQARFMLARLNPSTEATVGSDGESIAFTEDITLNVFLQHLKKLVVANVKEN